MARSTGISPEQLRALDRLSSIEGIGRFYLAGGAAIAFHLRHRQSLDLDLFGSARAPFRPFQAFAQKSRFDVDVIAVGDASLRLRVGQVPIDVVRYPYPLLERSLVGPKGFRVPTLLDLATMKLAAIARRGLARRGLARGCPRRTCAGSRLPRATCITCGARSRGSMRRRRRGRVR